MPSGVTSPSPANAYRLDIDGLRAVSILAVVCFHAGVDRFSGGYVGVDVFFVVSGFLITGLLLREVESTGRIAIGTFYARRIRRLLPLSATVIVSTLLLGMWLLPPIARERLVGDANAATLYVANWRYAEQATAYSDTEVTEGLLVHYWSLSIEEQFYLLWPFLILSGTLVARRLGRPARPFIAVLLAALVGVSLVAALVITDREGIGAYYLTHTRLWEMGVGAGLAIFAPRLGRLPAPLRHTVGVAGLAMILWSATTYDATTPFPGSAALIPVLGCAMLIATGAEGSVVSRALAQQPLPFVGRLSYAWYLCHWPAIGISLLLRERYEWSTSVGVTTAAAVAVSFGIAAAAHVLIENPARFAPRLRRSDRPNFVIGVALTLLPLLIGAALLTTVDRGDSEIVVESEGGALRVRQTPAEAEADNVLMDEACHTLQPDTEVAPGCLVGDPDGDVSVVVLGDSHARQWADVFDALGTRRGWAVRVWTKSACSVVDVTVHLAGQNRTYTECDAWRSEVQARVAALDDVDLVVLARAAGYRDNVIKDGVILGRDEMGPVWAAGFERTTSYFAGLGATVVVMTDTPWLPFNPPECLSQHPQDAGACTYDRDAAQRDVALTAAEKPYVNRDPRLHHVDPSPLICDQERCGVISDEGIITYRDSHHLTRTYSLSLVDGIDELLQPIVDELR